MLGHGEHSGEYGVMPDPEGDGRLARFESFYGDHYLEMSGYVRRRVAGPDAGDVVGRIFMVAWRRFDRIPSPPEDRLWLYGVARRCVADCRRSGFRRIRLHIRLAQQSYEEAQTVERIESEHSGVSLAMESLRSNDREVLQLVLWDELSHAEAASLLGCSVNAFELRYRRAKNRLRVLLAEPQAPIESITPELPTASEAWRVYPT
jgi:RNA polymerase sigma factor (sigma-70 family)